MPNQHYYSATPASPSRPQTVSVYVRGEELQITTDSGVFSKHGLDYGTRLLIESVELPPRATVVDLGCGYGVVTAVLGKVYADTGWILLDVNERAVELARRNTSFMGNRASAFVSDGFTAAGEVRADAVLLNPPIRAGKAVVYRLFEEAANHLTAEGALWIVIHKKHGAPSAKRKLEELFRQVEVANKDAGYHIFVARETLG